VHLALSCHLYKVSTSMPHTVQPTMHNNVFIILFFHVMLQLFVINSFILVKASFAIAILDLISVSVLPSLVIHAPWYFNLSICSIFDSSSKSYYILLHSLWFLSVLLPPFVLIKPCTPIVVSTTCPRYFFGM